MLGNAQKQYNHLNLPTIVIFGTTGQIDYIYDATGVKLKKTVTQTTGGTNTTSYAGGYVYLKSTLQFMSQPEGYIDPVAQTSQVKGSSNGTTTYSAYNYIFQFKDHLGNIRLSYGDSDKNGAVDTSEIIEESHYYPFGLKQKGYNEDISSNGNSLAQKWSFLGQERIDDFGLNWLTFRYRNYMPDLGRFFGIDPISENFMSITNYQFAHNSPVWKIEIEGLEGDPTSGEEIVNEEHFQAVNTASAGEPEAAFLGGLGKIVEQAATEAPKEITKKSSLLKNVLRVGGAAVGAVVTFLAADTAPNFGGNTQEMETSDVHRIIDDRVETYYQSRPTGSSEKTDNSDSEIIYRGGPFTDKVFTPRAKDAGIGPRSGLSANKDPLQATNGKGGKVQALSVDALKEMGFQLTEELDGHVGIRPPSQNLLQEWAKTREGLDSGNSAHILTHMVKSARMGQMRLPKQK